MREESAFWKDECICVESVWRSRSRSGMMADPRERQRCGSGLLGSWAWQGCQGVGWSSWSDGGTAHPPGTEDKNQFVGLGRGRQWAIF